MGEAETKAAGKSKFEPAIKAGFESESKPESATRSRVTEKVAVVIGSAIVGMLSNSLQTAFFSSAAVVFDSMPAVWFSMLCTALTAVWLLFAAALVSMRPSVARVVPWLFAAPTGLGIALLAGSLLVWPVLAIPAVVVLSCGVAFGFLFWIVLTARFSLGEALAILIAFRLLSALGALFIKPLGHSTPWLIAMAALFALSVGAMVFCLRSGAKSSFNGDFQKPDFALGPVLRNLWEPILFVSILGFASGTMRAFFQPDRALPSSLIVFLSTVVGVLAFYLVYRRTRGKASVLGVRLAVLLGITALYLVIPCIDSQLWVICSGVVDVCYVAATMSMNLCAVRESNDAPARAIVVLGLFKGCVFLSIALGFIVNNALGAIVQQDTTLSFVISLMGVYVILLATVFVVLRRLKLALSTSEAPVLVNLSEGQLRGNQALQSTYGITEREMDVLVLAMTGSSVPAIGKQLYISENTVKTYLKRIYTKLDVHSRDELRAVVTELTRG